MPLYEYELCEGDCKVCGREIHVEPSAFGQAAHELSRVPQAGAQNHFQFQSPQKLKPVSISDAKKAGFTVLKKVSKGEYERQ